jgi:hypothetical protein
VIAAFFSRALRDPDYPTNFADEPAQCPYDRPFEHAAGCGCTDCGRRALRRAALGCVAVVLIASILIFGLTL